VGGPGIGSTALQRLAGETGAGLLDLQPDPRVVLVETGGPGLVLLLGAHVLGGGRLGRQQGRGEEQEGGEAVHELSGARVVEDPTSPQ